ncbi:MAG: RNA polymerase factor sigma-54 [Zoogloeaceae bacterium]|jgi:RNA polymerase sigma-54 factor|nr:RNA polymerase factor sigma-54 [Zoogloeaceae bacterium]
MKPSLQLKISPQLVLTPQLQQSIKLLQLSTLEMQQEIERYLLENPLLEREDEFGDGEGGSEFPAFTHDREARQESGDEKYTQEEEDARDTERAGESELSVMELEEERWYQDGSGAYGSDGYGGRDRNDEEVEAQDLRASATTLRDHLLWQLGLSLLSDRQKALIRILIEALDDDGYLTVPLRDLWDSIPQEYKSNVREWVVALRNLQSLDPVGVGARSLKESLRLQLRAAAEEEVTPVVKKLALDIVERHLELLANRDFATIRKRLACSEENLKAAQALITSLNPHPGARFSSFDVRYIVPDVLVRKVRGRWLSQINPDAYPKLRVNRLYADILARQRRGDSPLSAQLQEARWLIRNVKQRFDTIARVSQSIVDRQRQFFEHGEVAMRPLVLREIADEVGLHESTISRVTSQKYMATPRGIFELKYFFGSHVATDTGGACSATAIRALIKQLIGEEDSKKPLSDNQISEILSRQGIVVARRTVAKYREAIGIPPVNLRKTL